MHNIGARIEFLFYFCRWLSVECLACQRFKKTRAPNRHRRTL